MFASRPLLLLISLCFALTGCLPVQASQPLPTPTLAGEIIYYDWEDGTPPEILEAFTAESGVRVRVLTYHSTEEAVQAIRAGLEFDLAVIEGDLISSLVSAGLLAELDFANLPNFKNISPSFQDLAFDPANRHSIPNSWGTTGLLVRNDLLAKPVRRWADLWDPQLAGKVAFREQPVEVVSVALKALGYPLNTEDPAALQAAEAHLLELRPSVRLVGYDSQANAALLDQGEVLAMVAWSGDALIAEALNPAISYILPQEGALLWADNFVIRAGSPAKASAELLINYLLRADVSARLVTETYYASANEAAVPLLARELALNPILFPSTEAIENGEWYLALSPEGERRYLELWERFTKPDK